MSKERDHARRPFPAATFLVLAGLVAVMAIYPAARANSQSGKTLSQLTDEITVLRAESTVQKRQIARLETQVSALDGRAGVSSRDYLVGHPRHRKITLQTSDGLVTLDNNGIVLEGRNVTVKGRAIVLSGDSIRLDANSISAKGGGDIVTKGRQIRDN